MKGCNTNKYMTCPLCHVRFISIFDEVNKKRFFDPADFDVGVGSERVVTQRDLMKRHQDVYSTNLSHMPRNCSAMPFKDGGIFRTSSQTTPSQLCQLSHE